MNISAPFDYEIYEGDCREIQTKITDESVDLIMTDPPWDDVNWIGWIAEVAVRILKPGGSVFAMCGKVDLDAAMCVMSEFLDYNWMCVGYQPQSNLQFMPRRIMEKWRPALWYTKGKRKQGYFISDLKSTNRDKRYHVWGQGTSFFMYYMDKIGGDVVFDPFVGGGTTLAVAKMLGRQAFGFEIDHETVTVARARIKHTQVPLIFEQPEQMVIWEE